MVFSLSVQRSYAQVVPIDDPIGRVATDTTDNETPNGTQTELQQLSFTSSQLRFTQHELTIELGPDRTIEEVVVLQVSGQMIFARRPHTPHFSYRFDGLPPGIYILRVRTQQGYYQQKIRIQ